MKSDDERYAEVRARLTGARHYLDTATRDIQGRCPALAYDELRDVARESLIAMRELEPLLAAPDAATSIAAELLALFRPGGR